MLSTQMGEQKMISVVLHCRRVGTHSFNYQAQTHTDMMTRTHRDTNSCTGNTQTHCRQTMQK